MNSELIGVCAVQLLVLALVIAALIFYLLRNLRCRSLLDVSGRTVLITGCDASLGWYLARHYDRLGFRVYAGCNYPAGEGAVRLQAEASTRLRIIPLDVTSAASLLEAARVIKEQMPVSEKGNSTIHPSIHLSIHPFIHPSIYSSIHPSIYPKT